MTASPRSYRRSIDSYEIVSFSVTLPRLLLGPATVYLEGHALRRMYVTTGVPPASSTLIVMSLRPAFAGPAATRSCHALTWMPPLEPSVKLTDSLLPADGAVRPTAGICS